MSRRWDNLLIYRRFFVDLFLFLVYVVFIWQGTNPKVLFTKAKLIFMFAFLIGELILTVITTLQMDTVGVLYDWKGEIK